MASKKLQQLFLVSLALIYLHGLEEILTGYQYQDSFMIFGANLFGTGPETFYWVSHILFWFALPVLYLAFKNSSFGLVLAGIFGLLFVVEFHHLVKGLVGLGYYPGTITALFYPILGTFFWRQWLKDWRSRP